MNPKNKKYFIQLKNISFEYTLGNIILNNISFKIEPGKILGIIGPNGGGKSTLLRIISGTLMPSEGEIFVNGDPIRSPLYEMMNMAYISQKDEVQCQLPLKVKDIIRLGHKNISLSKEEEVLSFFNLNGLRSQLFEKLSGGQRQRVLLAKAMATNPDLLILDEPTKGLDSLGQDQLLNLMNKIIEEKPNTSIIIVDHNLNQVIQHSHSILCLNRTHHWHDKKELIDQNIINSVYHCEFEHTLIHESFHDGDLPPHHECNHEPGHHHKKEDE